MSLNRVTLVGNVGQEPKVVRRENGEDFVTFSFATHETYKDKEGERQSKTEWHNVVVFNPGLAKVVKEHVGEGKPLIIEGKITYRTAEAGDENGKRYFTDIVARDITFLPNGKGNAESPEEETAQ